MVELKQCRTFFGSKKSNLNTLIPSSVLFYSAVLEVSVTYQPLAHGWIERPALDQ